jgi:hypothetical protein
MNLNLYVTFFLKILKNNLSYYKVVLKNGQK